MKSGFVQSLTAAVASVAMLSLVSCANNNASADKSSSYFPSAAPGVHGSGVYARQLSEIEAQDKVNWTELRRQADENIANYEVPDENVVTEFATEGTKKYVGEIVNFSTRSTNGSAFAFSAESVKGDKVSYKFMAGKKMRIEIKYADGKKETLVLNGKKAYSSVNGGAFEEVDPCHMKIFYEIIFGSVQNMASKASLRSVQSRASDGKSFFEEPEELLAGVIPVFRIDLTLKKGYGATQAALLFSATEKPPRLYRFINYLPDSDKKLNENGEKPMYGKIAWQMVFVGKFEGDCGDYFLPASFEFVNGENKAVYNVVGVTDDKVSEEDFAVEAAK